MAGYKDEIFGKIEPGARLHLIYATFVPLVGLVLMAVVPGLVLIPAFLADWVPTDDQQISNPGLLYVLAVSFGALSLAVFAWVKWVEKRPLASMGWRFERAFARYGRGFAIGLGMNIISIALIGLAGGYEVGAWLPAMASPMALVWIFLFLIGFVIQGGTEEVLTRGWLMSTFASRWGWPAAVGVTSVMFALMHIGNEPGHINWIAMTNIVLIGIFFGLYAVREKSLMGVCAAHASWNWMMGIGFGLNVSAMKIDVAPLLVELEQMPLVDKAITGGSFGPEGSLIVSAVLAVSCWLVWRWKGEEVPDKGQSN
ncbi:MAG: CPBP family intramembrane metalloprotease domain-containing protein [Robiginitomaculum sp.]|nr:MAG: CPBP family intramembrane metalloprotease domain-containing protein [Robiginitomaculum sp.]